MKTKTCQIDKELKQVLLVAVILFALRLLFVAYGPIDLSPDEAHYWEWSRYLDFSYYSKPPLIAWLTAISTSVFGDTHLGVRFFSCLALSILSVIAFLIAKNAAGQKAGWLALILFNVTPIFSAGGLMMTPDVPSLVFWATAIYILTKTNFVDNDISIKRFVYLGIIVGFAGLAKYTTALFYPILFIYLLFSPRRARWIIKPHIYIAGLVSLAMQLPVFYWNYMHGFVGLKHVLGQSSGGGDFSGFKSLGNFIGGQLGVISPITFILLICAWIAIGWAIFSRKKEENNKQKTLELLWYFSAPIFFAFLIKSYGAKVQPNWPVLSMYIGLIVLAIWVGGANIWFKRTFIAGIAISILISTIAHDTFIVRKALSLVGSDIVIPFKRDPLKPALGWRGLGQAVSALVQDENALILTTRYQTASEMAFYMAGNPQVIYVNPGHRRRNQYDLWHWPSDIKTRNVIYVRENGTIEPFIFNAFGACAHLGEVSSRRDTVIMRKANVYSCYGFKGIERLMPEVY